MKAPTASGHFSPAHLSRWQRSFDDCLMGRSMMNRRYHHFAPISPDFPITQAAADETIVLHNPLIHNASSRPMHRDIQPIVMHSAL